MEISWLVVSNRSHTLKQRNFFPEAVRPYSFEIRFSADERFLADGKLKTFKVIQTLKSPINCSKFYHGLRNFYPFIRRLLSFTVQLTR